VIGAERGSQTRRDFNGLWAASDRCHNFWGLRAVGVYVRRTYWMVLDADSISRLYRAHAAALLRFFMRRTFDPEVAVDLVADTFLAAVADRGSFRGRCDEDAVRWLYGIARHRLADFLRHGRVERRALERAGFQRRALSDPEYERIEELAGLSELRDHVAVGLDGLSEEQREALVLRVVQERSYQEVATALGISQQTARARVSRAVAALRRSLPLDSQLESNDCV
jgi:RNA polymerase sigma factor (sigma-70 family)